MNQALSMLWRPDVCLTIRAVEAGRSVGERLQHAERLLGAAQPHSDHPAVRLVDFLDLVCNGEQVFPRNGRFWAAFEPVPDFLGRGELVAFMCEIRYVQQKAGFLLNDFGELFDVA
ncbi:MAG TPA: hypothetical protein PLK99_11185 [Burkholderiales bacterium]|nr:hypothetical protein [Burkholderiales bacterium]